MGVVNVYTVKFAEGLQVHLILFWNSDEQDLQEILKGHQLRCISRDGANDIIVRRARLLQTAFVAVRSKTFNCCKEITVKFSGEDGSDAGGPRREFFRYIH